jgi:hypothetical protein
MSRVHGCTGETHVQDGRYAVGPSIHRNNNSDTKFLLMHKSLFIILLMLLLTACSASNSGVPESEDSGLQLVALELTTDYGAQQQFYQGDVIQFLLSLGSDAYIYMYLIDASSNIIQLLPHKDQRSHYYSAGYFLTIPEYENAYRFTVGEPFGEQSVWIIASDQSLTLSSALTSIEMIKQKIRQSSIQAYGEYVFNMKTLR